MLFSSMTEQLGISLQSEIKNIFFYDIDARNNSVKCLIKALPDIYWHILLMECMCFARLVMCKYNSLGQFDDSKKIIMKPAWCSAWGQFPYSVLQKCLKHYLSYIFHIILKFGTPKLQLKVKRFLLSYGTKLYEIYLILKGKSQVLWKKHLLWNLQRLANSFFLIS